MIEREMSEKNIIDQFIDHVNEKGPLHDSSACEGECDFYYELNGDIIDALVNHLNSAGPPWLPDLINTLGWQGGTIHQALEEVKNLKEKADKK